MTDILINKQVITDMMKAQEIRAASIRKLETENERLQKLCDMTLGATHHPEDIKEIERLRVVVEAAKYECERCRPHGQNTTYGQCACESCKLGAALAALEGEATDEG